MKKGWFVVLCVLGMAFAACVDYAKAPAAGGLGSDVEMPVECFYNSDCTEGQKCVKVKDGWGVCVDLPPVGKPDVVVNEPDTALNPDSSPPVGEDGGEGDATVTPPGPDTIPPGPDTIVGPDTVIQPDTEPQGPDTTPVGPDTESNPDSSPPVGEDGGEGDTVEPACESSPEVCDNKDNDCDGHTDEGQPVFKTTCGIGACVSTGTLACKNGELVDACVEGEAAADDITCDNKDDDCDSETDEDFGEIHSSCGVGACADSGQVTCEDGKEIDSCIPKEPGEVELCDNDLDDDCDGAVNEDCPCTKPGNETKDCGPDPVQAGVGECKFGTQFCVDGGTWSDCFDEVLPTAEVCDGLDNDCDGATDNGVLNACGQCGAVPSEVCDGADNNCDGQIDEGLLNACGSCGDVPIEICNGLDDDCDGEVDEGATNVCGGCGDVPSEICGNGVDEDCDGSDAECPPPPCEPTTEVCDGADNDCNGETDECCYHLYYDGDGDLYGLNEDNIFACEPVGKYTTGTGGDCDDNDPAIKPSIDAFELCDGKDNDCDGWTDEGVKNACGGCEILPHAPGDPCDSPVDFDTCGEDTYQCSSLNSVACVTAGDADGDGWSLGFNPSACPCSAACDFCNCDTPNEGNCPVEYNGTQDGCDCGCQFVDSDCPGACISDCDDNDSAIFPGATEVCDGADNDCDGQTDEGLLNQCGGCGVLDHQPLAPCDGSDSDLCEDDFYVCLSYDPNVVFCQTNWGGAGKTEGCNGLDDDCDGETDEEFVSSATTCGVGVCASTGTLSCVDGQKFDSCTPNTSASRGEECNSLDDDCDGETDEGLDTVAECGVGECASVGPKKCINGIWNIWCTPGTPTLEICDGLDNNCDGLTDEQLGSTTCGVGACQKTVENCLGGQVQTCVPGAPTAEVCGNGVDEDCDGTDLACPPPPPVCTPTNLHGTYATADGVDGCLKAYTCGTYPPVTAGTTALQVSSVEFDFPLKTVCFNVSIDEDCDGDVEFDINTGEGWACNFWGVGYVKGLLIMEKVSACDDGTTVKETMAVESQDLAGGGNCVVF